MTKIEAFSVVEISRANPGLRVVLLDGAGTRHEIEITNEALQGLGFKVTEPPARCPDPLASEWPCP